MEEFMKADIFFFISSVVTVVLAIFVSVLLFYFIKAGKNLYKLTEALKENFEDSEAYVSELKDRLEDNMVFRLFFPPARRRRKIKAKKGSAKNNN